MSHYNPDQYTEPQQGLEPDRDLDEGRFADWVKPNIIAEIIFEELESAGIPPTLENAKLVYLDILENALYEAVTHSIEYLPAFAGYRSGQIKKR